METLNSDESDETTEDTQLYVDNDDNSDESSEDTQLYVDNDDKSDDDQPLIDPTGKHPSITQ